MLTGQWTIGGKNTVCEYSKENTQLDCSVREQKRLSENEAVAGCKATRFRPWSKTSVFVIRPQDQRCSSKRTLCVHL